MDLKFLRDGKFKKEFISPIFKSLFKKIIGNNFEEYLIIEMKIT